MGQIFTVKKLPPAKLASVDAIIRQHQYSQLNTMVTLLAGAGVHVSRSALHRYTKDLEKRDGARCQDENITVVVIVSRATGKTTTHLTPASAAKISAAINAIDTAR